MTEPWTPSTADIADLFQPLESYPRLILAVSGGSDSMALMHLAVRWMEFRGDATPVVSVATVDHGLRVESQSEAAEVAAAARALGLRAHVLPWEGPKPTHGIQEQARQMRYRLLGECALAAGDDRCAILTAHTRDDQAETLLMRLARGSGPDGLQGMRPVRALTPFPDVDLARPLLGLSRAALQSFLAAIGVRWLEDPSNADRRFERIRFRDAHAVLTGLGLRPEMLALAAARQRRTVDALEAATDDLQAAALDLHDGAFAAISAGILMAHPEDIRVRLLGRVLTMFGGTSPPAELAQIERLAHSLSTQAATRTTLGGCEIRACRREIRVYRERGRAGLASLRLRPGEEATWDHRFLIRVNVNAQPIEVRALDLPTLADLRTRTTPQRLPPARAAATLPAIWAGGELISVGGLPSACFAERSASPLVETRFLFGRRNVPA